MVLALLESSAVLRPKGLCSLGSRTLCRTQGKVGGQRKGPPYIVQGLLVGAEETELIREFPAPHRSDAKSKVTHADCPTASTC